MRGHYEVSRYGSFTSSWLGICIVITDFRDQDVVAEDGDDDEDDAMDDAADDAADDAKDDAADDAEDDAPKLSPMSPSR